MSLVTRVRKFKHRNGKLMSAWILKRSIKAMKTLILMYLVEDTYSSCPLCQLHCRQCPWTVIGGPLSSCTYKSSVIWNGGGPARVQQIRRWIKAYETVLKERE